MFTCKVCGSTVEAGQPFCATCGADVTENYECECSSCGTKNPTGTRFCSKCGNMLGRLSKPVCQICGATNLPGTKFCATCGAPLPRDEETHNSVDIMEMRNAKLNLDLMAKERMKAVDKEIEEKHAKILEEEDRSIKAIDDYRAQTNEELSKQAEMLDAYRETLNQMGSEDVAKLREVATGLHDVVDYYANPYEDLEDDQLEGQTYICPICGAINGLNATQCAHCGRSRAKAERLLEKGKIQQAAPTRYGKERISAPATNLDAPHTPTFAEFAGAEFEEAQNKPIEFTKEQPMQPQAQPQQGAPCGAPYGAPYGYPPYGAPYGQYQMPPIVQPVAFVPFVTQDQPLMQYQPANNAGRPSNK